MFRTQPIPAEFLPPDDALPQVLYGLPELAYPPHMNFAEALVDGALDRGIRRPHCLLSGADEVTYLELSKRVNRLANGLLELGIELGDRVLLRLNDGLPLVYALLALQRVGAVPVPTYTLLRSTELAYRINDTEAIAIIVEDDLLPALEEVRPNCPTLLYTIVNPQSGSSMTSYDDLLADQSETCPAANTGRDDIAMILYTSGTTGDPKGVIQSHADLLANGDCAARYGFNIQAADVLAGPPALPFAMGFAFFVTYALRSGAASVLFPEKTPALMLEAIQRHGVTILAAVPTFYNLMLGVLANDAGYKLDSLRLCVTAGEPMPSAVFDQWQSTTGLELFNILGATEQTGAIAGYRRQAGLKPETIGRAIHGYHIAVRDPETFNEVPRNTEGVLTLIGATGTTYWRKPEQQREAVRQGWSIIPDIVTMDDEGYISYVARAD